jgi:hypothetical protein
VDAGDGGGAAQRAALESLCRSYWAPLYAFVRRRRWSAGGFGRLTPGGLGQGANDANPPQRASVATWRVANRNREFQPSFDYTMQYTTLSVTGELLGGGAGEARRQFHQVNLAVDEPYEDLPE